MGSVNGVSMKVDNCTTNAVTGHFLSLTSALFDLCAEGRHKMPIAAQRKMLLSAGVVLSLLLGIGMGQVVADHSDFDNYATFNPTFSILGVCYALVLGAHNFLGLESWPPEQPKEANCDSQCELEAPKVDVAPQGQLQTVEPNPLADKPHNLQNYRVDGAALGRF